jgi:hypothetical protein
VEQRSLFGYYGHTGDFDVPYKSACACLQNEFFTIGFSPAGFEEKEKKESVPSAYRNTVFTPLSSAYSLPESAELYYLVYWHTACGYYCHFRTDVYAPA